MDGPISEDGYSNAITHESPNDGRSVAGDPTNDGNPVTGNPLGKEYSESRGVLHIRTTIPLPWAIALEHTIADLRLTKAEALREAVALYLRFHGRGQGIPEPRPPVVRQ